MHPSHITNKVCLAPYCWHKDSLLFLIHLPKAKNPDEQNRMQWGLVRGTVRDVQGSDLKAMEALRALPPQQIEDHWQTALAEGWEEAGITEADLRIDTKRDHGHMDYASLTKPPYPLHIFSVETDEALLTTFRARMRDAAGLQFATMEEALVMMQEKQFKPGYIPILRAIETALR